MQRLAQTLAPYLDVQRFNFPYRDAGSARPDPMPVLKAAFEKQVRAKSFIGGRSMGGRVATMLAADGFACLGLLLFAYPLHAAGQPQKLRAAHLENIGVPVLCFNGTRDPLCTRELMDRAVGGLPNWRMHWLEGADHSFRVLKSSGRTDADVDAEIGQAAASWLLSLQ